MNLFDIFFVIVCGIGSLNSFLLAAYIFFNKKGNSFFNKVLALLIFSFSLRVAKIVWVFFFESIHPFYDLVWYFSLAMVAPLYSLYTFGLTSESIAKRNLFRNISILAAPVIFILITIYNYTHHMLIFQLIVISIAPAIIYSAIKIYTLSSERKTSNKIPVKWLKIFLVFMIVIFSNFILFVLFRTRFLYIEAFIFSFFVYYWVYQEITNNLITKAHRGVKNPTPLNTNVSDKLEELMESRKIFHDPQLTLPALAKMLTISTHDLSRLLNESFGMNFNDFINHYRIEEAKKLLAEHGSQNKKISSLAFECGFNSISVFNTAFKKFTGKTPSKYQSEIFSK